MVFDSWVNCSDRFPSLKLGYCRNYYAKDRYARVAEGFAEAALLTFREFVTYYKNAKFKFRFAEVMDPETRVSERYQIVLRDGRPYLRQMVSYGYDGVQPKEIAVPDFPDRVRSEAMSLAQEWQALEDALDAARYAAIAQKEGKPCR